MAAPVHLTHPPIKETLFDIRLADVAQVSLELLEGLKPLVSDRYPDIQEIQRKEARFDLSAGKLATETRDLGAVGLLCRSADRKSAAQFRSDGFTLNWLEHYTSADDLYAEAIRLWSMFVNVAEIQPESVTRFALRYINRFHLPLSDGDPIDKYLTFSPPIPVDLPQAVSEFVVRVGLVEADGDPTLVLTQKLGASKGGSTPEMILDLDASSTRRLGTADSILKPKFDQLRDLKNRGFFSVLTEDAVKLFL